MAEKLYVYSTLSTGVDYTTYVKNDPKSPVVIEQVVSIAGGANVVAKGAGLLTPHGVATAVTPEQLDALRANAIFQLHEANGFVTVSKAKEDPENVATDMTTRDTSAPLVQADFEAEGMEVPETGNIKLPKGPGRKA
jgi:hypothetical protein